MMSDEILKNSKARRDYEILESLEAGLVLQGTEVKSLRAGKGQLREAFARIEPDGEAWLHNFHIDKYAHGNIHNHRPIVPRKLLLHRKEIDRLAGQTQAKGLALIPLKLYWKNGRVKVLLGLGRGKGHADKRETIKKRESDKDLRRAMMHTMKGKAG